jgi:N-acetylmuramoyl-L-alanine amidase
MRSPALPALLASALLASALLAVAPATRAQAPLKIYLDPGHGGSDPGAVNSTHGTKEAARVLVTALELRRLLEKDTADAAGGAAWSVRLSRTTDVFIPLGSRSADANAWGADRFLSIHQNAFNRTANGTETFSLANAGTAAELRNLVQAEALKAWGLANRGTKTAGFSVLRNSAMPAVLTEMGFIDSPVDHPFCASDEKCRLYARHLLFALQRHAGKPAYLPAGAVPELLADNADPVRYAEDGEWHTSPYAGAWKTESRWASVEPGTSPSNLATFRPGLTEPGRYEVAAWWLAGANRSPAAAFVVHHAAGSTTVPQDQRSGGRKWNVLGTFDFSPGPDARVVLDSSASSVGAFPTGTVVSADAVRFIRLGDASAPPPPPPPAPAEIVVDNASPGFSAPGTAWFTASHVSGFVGTDYHARPTGYTSNPATWSARLPQTGKWEVFARWTSGTNRASSAPYVVLHQGGTTTRFVDQRRDHATWVSLGTYDFAAGDAPRVRLSCWTVPGAFVIADAVRFVPR